MPTYWPLKYIDNRDLVISNLQLLRQQIRAEMPQKTTTDTLILGTWNIRNFDDNRMRFGPRSKASLYYIAEIINAFDVLAIQEICRDLDPLEDVMNILGPHFDYIVSDVTEGKSGNTERLGFIYNKNKVDFKGVTGEIVLPDDMMISDVNKSLQFSRTPFSVAFQSHWFKFVFATVHIYYGNASKNSAKYKRRVKEIDKVAEFISERADKEPYNYVLVGDFNIEAYEDSSFDALQKHGFEVRKNKMGSNAKQNKFYDQISFKARKKQVRIGKSDKSNGVFNFFKTIMKDSEEDALKYLPDHIKLLRDDIVELKDKQSRARFTRTRNSYKKKIGKKEDEIKSLSKLLTKNGKKAQSYSDLEKKFGKQWRSKEWKKWYRTYKGKWRTYQLSDHFPLWVELEIDFSKDYLDAVKSGKYDRKS